MILSAIVGGFRKRLSSVSYHSQNVLGDVNVAVRGMHQTEIMRDLGNCLFCQSLLPGLIDFS